MKIAYSCQVPLGQGFAQVAQQAVNALNERGHEVELFVPHTRNPGVSGFDEWHDQYTALHMSHGINVFCGWANASLQCIKRAKIIGAKSIIHRGSAHILFQKEVLDAEGIHLSADSVTRQVAEYENVDHIIVDSTFIRDTFEKYSPHLIDKVHVVNLGVDTEKFSYQPQRQDKFVVLFVGQNVRRKGLDYLIAAWNKLNLNNAQLRVIGVDNGAYPYRTDINYMRWAENLIQEYHNANILCLPSIEDGWGMVAGEAMSCGRPVIISNNTGAKDMVDHGTDGLVILPADWEDIAWSINYFYHNREFLEQMGKNASAKAEQYTWQRYKDEFIKIIEIN